jgi:hypothetical protein
MQHVKINQSPAPGHASNRLFSNGETLIKKELTYATVENRAETRIIPKPFRHRGLEPTGPEKRTDH